MIEVETQEQRFSNIAQQISELQATVDSLMGDRDFDNPFSDDSIHTGPPSYQTHGDDSSDGTGHGRTVNEGSVDSVST